ncbi:hypothetical protein H4R35_003809 [Dimargaris xerosporica]|nr:hypothetical protein H4R35_003809 [Dimargaris xerosporica]
MRFVTILLHLTAVVITQLVLPKASQCDAGSVLTKLFNVHQNINQVSMATIEDMPPEVLAEVLKQLDPTTLRAIQRTSHQFNSTITMLLSPEYKMIEAQYLQDPTILVKDTAQDWKYQNKMDSSAARAQLGPYFWRHLQFRWNHGLLPRSGGLSSSQKHITADMVVDSLRDDVIIFCKIYLQKAHPIVPTNNDFNPTPPLWISYPDIFTVLSVPHGPDYGEAYQRLQQSVDINSQQSVAQIRNGILGAFNADYVVEIPALVEKYLEVVSRVDLLPSLSAHQEDPIYDILTSKVVLNDFSRAWYVFNDIIAFQVIPTLIMAYVAKGYFDDVLAFIDRMRNNPYLARFGQYIQVDTGLNYYECAAYTALYMHSKKVAVDFVNQLQSKELKFIDFTNVLFPVTV